MLKCLSAVLIALVLSTSSVSFVHSIAKTGQAQVTPEEDREAREVASQFTLRFIRGKDVAPIVKDLYWGNFIDRYKASKSKDLKGNSTDLLLVSGIDYNSRLLAEGNSQDWQRFYIAANNFLLLGLLNGLTHLSLENSDIKTANLKPTDMYPSSVIELLGRNPNLANTILRKGNSRAVESVGEMRSAIATLERAVSITRQQNQGRSLARIEKLFVRVMAEDQFFGAQVETDEEFFGFPKGTRILSIKTPIGLQLMLARDGNRLKIFSTDMFAD